MDAKLPYLLLLSASCIFFGVIFRLGQTPNHSLFLVMGILATIIGFIMYILGGMAEEEVKQ